MATVEKNFQLTQFTKGKLPSLPFVRIKDAVLGKDYNLSLVFVGKMRARKLNLLWRNKNYPTDILSFPLTKKSGEIFICPPIVEQKAPGWNRPTKNFLAFLLIHGLCHLKGFAHGSRMEAQEIKFRNKFGI